MLNRIILFITVLCFTQLEVKSQLIVASDMSPEFYVQNVLLDANGGVEAFNITFNGAPGDEVNNQCGLFEGNDGMIDLCDGVILATGNVINALGPNDNGGAFEDPQNSISGDADLEQLNPGFDVNDIAILEFDFIPNGDTLRFNYIFGSDEYLEFVNSSFNDVFGFFLSGPGITGPFSTPDPVMFPDGAANIALIPGTDQGVTIDNVNDMVNSEFYIVNGTGVNNPFMSDDFYVQYDGVTVVLEAFAPLIVGETYHIKLAVADAGDTSFDSGVFLEGGSFTTGNAGITANTPNVFFDNPATLIEQSSVCDTGFFEIFRDDCNLDSLWYEFVYEGDAEWNVDYLPLPLDTFMVEDQALLTYPMFTIPDEEDEGIEVIQVLVFTSETGEEGSFAFQDTIFIDIVENYTFPLDAPNITAFCPVDSLNVQAFPLPVGLAPFEYTWTQDGEFIGDDFQAFVPVPETPGDSVLYEISVIDFCGMPSIPDSVYMRNQIPSAPTVEVMSSGVACVGVPFALNADITAGSADFEYDWSDENFIFSSTDNPALVTPNEATEYFVTITDNCGRTADASQIVTLPEPVELVQEIPDYACLDEVLELSAQGAGGVAPYTYNWSLDPTFGNLEFNSSTGNGTVTNMLLVDEDDNTVFVELEMFDFCQEQRNEQGIFIGTEIFEIEEPVTLLDCIVPNVITPNGDQVNNFFQAEELLARQGTMFIYDRWGKLLHESSEHTWDPGNAPDGTYFYVVQFEDGLDVEKGSFTILR